MNSENEEIEVEVEVDDLSSALADAWDASEGENGDTGLEGSEVLESSSTESDSIASDPIGASAGTDKGAAENGAIPVTAEKPEGVGGIDQDNEKPPVGLSLEARESWKDTPDAVKADIRKREADYAAGIEKHRNATERVQGMDRALQPYGQYLQMNGGAGPAIQSLLQTGSSLQMGSPQQKAQIVAGLIQQFGVDVRQLDSMLVGEAPTPESQQQSQFEQMLNQRLQPMQQQLQDYQQREQQQQQQVQNQIGQEVNEFGAANEFYNDVRADMADLLDMAANRGRPMSMEQAYQLACGQHPQISKILAQRASQVSVDTKKRTASSITGNPGGRMTPQAPNSVAAALNAAWDNAGQM